MSKRTNKAKKAGKEEVVAVIYRDKDGNTRIMPSDLEEMELIEVRPPNRKRRKSA